jgi:hypothetical protein
MPGLPVNGKHGRSASDFDHMPCCMLLLSLIFSVSSERTLYSQIDEVFTFISLSLLYSLAEISLYSLSCYSSYNTASSLARISFLGLTIVFSGKNSNQGQLSCNQQLPATL